MRAIKFLIVFFILAGVAFAQNADEKKKVYRETVDKDGIQKKEVMGGVYFYNPDYITVKKDIPVELIIKKEPGIAPHNIIIRQPEAGMDIRESIHDLIDTAIKTYESIESYQVTLKTSNNNVTEEIKYYFKKPGYVRIEFIKPHKGALLVYNPFKKEVRLMPFGFLRFFILTLSPGNKLIKNSKGHGVDESDIGALLKMVKRLQSHGNSMKLKDETVGKRQTVLIRVEGEGDFNVDGIHMYLLWLDKKTLMPLKVSAYNTQGKLIEEVLMDDLQINIEFPEQFFALRRF